MNILLTGGTGLIGRALYPLLREKGYSLKLGIILRKKPKGVYYILLPLFLTNFNLKDATWKYKGL